MPNIPIPPALQTARTRGAVAMKAMPALMNGTFSPYCSVMRVFNMGFFRVAADYRVSAPMRPMNFVWRPFVGIPRMPSASYHLPTCAPPSTCSTSPVTCRASVK